MPTLIFCIISSQIPDAKESQGENANISISEDKHNQSFVVFRDSDQLRQENDCKKFLFFIELYSRPATHNVLQNKECRHASKLPFCSEPYIWWQLKGGWATREELGGKFGQLDLSSRKLC